MEARKLPLRSKRNRNPSRSNRKNRKSHRIWNPKSRWYFFTKTENQMLNNGKSVNCNEHQNRKPEVLWHKNRETDLKNNQNRKTENPNAPLMKTWCWKVAWSNKEIHSFRCCTASILPVSLSAPRNLILWCLTGSHITILSKSNYPVRPHVNMETDYFHFISISGKATTSFLG